MKFFKKSKKTPSKLFKNIHRFAVRIREISLPYFKKAKKWYFQNSSVTFPITGVMAIMLVFACFNVFNTFSRVGFNQNVTVGIDAPTNAWFNQLEAHDTGLAAANALSFEDTRTYNKYDNSITEYSGGNGTENDPYIITNAKQLELIGSENFYTLNANSGLTGKSPVRGYFEYAVQRVTPYSSERASDGWRTLYHSHDRLNITNTSGYGVRRMHIVLTSNDNSNGDVFNTDYVYLNGEPITNFRTHNYNWGNRSFEIDFNCNVAGDEPISLEFDVTSYNNPSRWTATTFEMTTEDGTLYYSRGVYTASGTAGVHYRLDADIDMKAEGDSETDLAPVRTPIGFNESYKFRGVFDGNYHTIKNLHVENATSLGGANSQAYGLFAYVENAVIKNLNFVNVKGTIVSNKNVIDYGLVVGNAKGSTKIYNIGIESGSIDMTVNKQFNNGAIGGIVGYMAGTTAVVNSYSYADINIRYNPNIFIGGLVGNRTGNNSLSRNTPVVYLLVNYGSVNVPSNANYQFVYNGTRVEVDQTPTYCYYMWHGDSHDSNILANNTYAILHSYEEITNSAFPAHLNNYRYMAAYYLGIDNNIKDGANSGYAEIANWYQNATTALLPKTKQHEEITNEKYMQFAQTEAEAISRFGANTSSKTNYIKAVFKNTSNSGVKKTLYLRVIGKDPNNFDYSNDKVVLPFNSRSTNFTYDGGRVENHDYVLTGWRLNKVKYKGTNYSDKEPEENIKYNLLLREGVKGATKDINTLYTQGGYYLVPKGVTELTFSTSWAFAVYISDYYNEQVYTNQYINNNGANQNYGRSDNYNYGNQYNNTACGMTPEQPCHSLKDAYERTPLAGNGKGFADIAFVLSGNFHYSDQSHVPTIGQRPADSEWETASWNTSEVTIMSIDKDNDLEPDYSFYTRNTHDQKIYGMRLDFVNFLSIPQVGTMNAKLNEYTIQKFTSTQNGAQKELPGNFEITETATTDRIDLRIKESASVKINGGFVNMYSAWRRDEAYNANMPYIYFGGTAKAININYGNEDTGSDPVRSVKAPVFNIGGGRIETLSSTYFTSVINISNNVYFNIDGGYIDNYYSTYNSSVIGSVTTNVNGSYINNYYAGGRSDGSNIQYGVTSTIKNSVIGNFYGGPQYGKITNWSVSNIANSIITGDIYGGGYGGTNTIEYGLEYHDNGNYCGNNTYDFSINYNFGSYIQNVGIETGFYALMYGKGGCSCKAYSKYYSSLSAAEVDRVFLNITDTKVKGNVYGGGNKGVVTNRVELNIKGDTVIDGDVYGGGLSNDNETVEVYENTSGYSAPVFRSYTIDSEAESYPKKVTYTWTSGNGLSYRRTTNQQSKLIYSPNVSRLGNVTGDIYVNVDGATIKGNLFGGGAKSDVTGNVHVNLYGDTVIKKDVYGGGDQAKVKNGSTDVRLNGGTYDNVYAGGRIETVDGEASITTLGDTKANAVYGSGYNADATSTNVIISSGEIDEVYGGANSGGTITTSNVKIGELNSVAPAYEGVHNTRSSKADDFPAQVNAQEHPYLPGADKCDMRDITYAYSIDSGNSNHVFSFWITNNTNVELTLRDMTVVFGNTLTSLEDWNGWLNYYNSNTHTAYWQRYQWGNSYNPEFKIGAGQTRMLTGRADNGQPLGQYSSTHNGADPIWLESVVINMFNGGRNYSSTTCNDPDYNPIEPSHDETLPADDTFTYPRPTTPTQVGDITIGDVYGGNNAGGTTTNTNVRVSSDKATIENVFGGGNLAATGNSNINLTKGSIENVFGGGNMGGMNGNTNVTINGPHITDSVFGGGKGSAATALGNTTVNILGTTEIDGSVFGGGDEAHTGDENQNTSKAVVNILGGTIHTNVYGGGNTAKILGQAEVNIGNTRDNLTGRAPITIDGSVFGGGESNANGDKTYDYSYNSVSVGINININGTNTNPVTIGGSIFGSGNAANSGGFSHINITKLGTRENPNFMASIQRADDVNIYDSTLVLAGAADSPNEFNYYNYSISRVNKLMIANNTSLYLEHDFNLVEQFDSMYVNGNTTVKAAVTIDDDGNFTRNTDNRIYSSAKKSNSVNIRDTESEVNATYKDVNGMTYFGLYIANSNHEINEGIYNPSVSNGDVVPENIANLFKAGSYVRAAHKANHDKTIDGFYSNFADPDTFEIKTKYVPVTSEETPYYEWAIGEQTTDIDINLIASKYATTGTGTVELADYSAPNTYFQIIDFGGAALKDGVTLEDSNSIPRIAASSEEAMSKFGLKMTSNSDSWITAGSSEFFYDGLRSSYTGTTKYVTDNSNNIASLEFYLAHSRNIEVQEELGTAVICIIAYVPVDEISYALTRININVNISTKVEDADGYEGVMTAGRKTELFVNGNTNISNKSQLSAYYSLFMDGNVYQDGGHRFIESTYKFPVNTRITFIDRSVEEKPVYYYYVVTEENYQNVEWEYNLYSRTNSRAQFYRYYLRDFIRMGSLSANNKYDDDVANTSNYYSDLNISAEEYIFTFDFSEASIPESIGSAEVFLTYQKHDARETQISTFRAGNSNTLYNVIVGGDAQLQLTLPEGNNTAYVGQDLDLSTNIKYVESVAGGRRVADTQFSQDKLGLKITLYNSDGNVVTGTSLLGTVFYINNTAYSANLDGSVRLKVADNVASINTVVNIDLSKSTLPTDNYRMVVEAFGSPDGLYFGTTHSFVAEKQIQIINEKYGLKVAVVDTDSIITGETGFTMDGDHEVKFNIDYTSRFEHPNIRVKLYRRKYDETYSLNYEEVDLQDYVTNELVEKAEHEYLVTNDPQRNNVYTLNLKDNLMTGTYKVAFEIYNNDSYIDSVHTYIFIK